MSVVDGTMGGMTQGRRQASDGAVRRRAERFERPLPLPGWSPSTWGYDPALESYWAELRREVPTASADGAHPPGGPVHISRDHLITTLPGLARAVARTARVPDAAALLALTA